MLLLTLLLTATPGDPTVPGAALPVDAQWAAIQACPKISMPDGPAASGVVIAVKDGFAYMLTAAHAVPYKRLEVMFTSREGYPKPVWFAEKAEVVGRWPDPDVALVRFPTARRDLPVLPLAPPGERPKTFPAEVLSVGVADGEQAATVQANTIRAKEFVHREGKEPAFFWKVEHPSTPGRSGGPLLDGRGRVIGL